MKKALVLLLAAGLAACDGSDGVDITAGVYQTNNPRYDAIGTVYSVGLTGSDSNGHTYTGSLVHVNHSPEMRNGVQVTPREVIFSLHDGSRTLTGGGTNYMDTNGHLIESVAGVVSCVPASTEVFPASVKIGDQGTYTLLSCSDGNTREGHWQVDAASGGRANVVEITTARASTGAVLWRIEVTTTIDIHGTLLGYHEEYEEPSTGFTSTLQSI